MGVEFYTDLLSEEVYENLFANPSVNKTLKRRWGSGPEANQIREVYKDVYTTPTSDRGDASGSGKERKFALSNLSPIEIKEHEGFMRQAVATAERGAENGLSKEHEPFGAVIVKGGKVICRAHNGVIDERDATAT